MSELKACPFCGGKDIIKQSVQVNFGISRYMSCNSCGAHGPFTHNEDMSHEDKWNNRPLEDALRTRAETAEKVIRGMFPLWINAMGYCEHGKKDQLVAMQNYYNGRDNPMTNEDVHLMFSLIPDKDGE